MSVVSPEFTRLLSVYNDNYVAFRVTGNIANKTAYEAAENAGAYDVSDFLAGRLASHKKHGWFLQSTIGNNVKD